MNKKERLKIEIEIKNISKELSRAYLNFGKELNKINNTIISITK